MAADGPQPLLIAGGSVRAAAESAIRAGFAPWCVDCFGDVDLVRACPTRVVRDYPKEIPKILASGPNCGWMYMGAMENHPEIIAAVDRPLYGNSASVVQQIRDPNRIYEVLSAAGFSVPELDFLDIDGDEMLLKPRKSGGGIGIRVWNIRDNEKVDWNRYYLQERIRGVPMSALYLGDGARTEAIAECRQLSGCDWLHAPGVFHHCGSIVMPLRGLVLLGTALAMTFGVRGLFGVDGILRDGTFWPVELNPRYVASIEVVERASQRKLISDHVALFAPDVAKRTMLEPFECTPLRGHPGKAIFYAPVDFTFPAAGPWDDDYPFADLRRRFADLPHPGVHIRRGQPVLTFFADGDSPDATEAALRKIAGDLDRLLFGR